MTPRRETDGAPLAQAFLLLRDPVVRVDDAGRVVWANGAAVARWSPDGVRPVVGRYLAELAPIGAARELDRVLDEARAEALPRARVIADAWEVVAVRDGAEVLLVLQPGVPDHPAPAAVRGESPADDAQVRFVLALSDAVRGLDDPAAVVHTALDLLRRQLGADRCAWAEAEADEEHVTVLGCAAAPGIAGVSGRFALSDFGSGEADALRDGSHFAVHDALRDLPEGALRSAYEATAIRSHLAVPLRRGGRLTDVLGVHMLAPRRWRDEEVALAREAMARCREAVERARAVAALRASEERFQLAARATNDAIWDWDPASGALWWNDGLVTLFGYDRAALSSNLDWWRERVHPDDRARVAWSLQVVLEQGEPGWSAEYRFRRADGSYANVLDRGYVLRDAAGRAVRMIGAMADLSAHRTTEANLRRREEEFRTLADNISQLAWMADATGELFWYNQRWYDYTGTTLEEVRGWGWVTVHHPEHVDRVRERIQQAWSSGEAWEDTFPLRGADGRYRWFLSRAIPIRDGSGAVVRWFGTNTDITEQLATEAALRESERSARALAAALEAERAKLAAVIDHLPVGVGVGTPDGRFLSMNRAGLATHGFASEAEMFARLPEYVEEYELRTPDGQLLPLEAWPASRAAVGDYVRALEVRLVHRSTGRERRVVYDVLPVSDETGAVVLLVYVLSDVTEAREAESALRASEATLAAVLDALPVGVIIADAQGRIVRDNAANRAIWGIPPETTSWEAYGEWVGYWPATGERIRAEEWAMSRALLRGEVVTSELVECEQFGTGRRRQYLNNAAPVRDARGAIIGGVVAELDVTEQRAAERRLEAAQRMETAGRIAGGVAHEANNQMTVVLGAAHFLGRRPDLPAEAREELEFIRQAAQRTASICQQLLAFSRRQVLRSEVLDPDGVVRATLPLIARALGERCTLALEFEAPAAAVRADRGQLEQVLLNLALNARDAMPEGGTVTLRSSVETLAASALHDLGVSLPPGTHWILAVRDTGSGMDAATRARIFEPFFTTKPVGQGTGLGLSMAQGVLRQSGGDVAVESAPEQGTTVRLLLPVVPDAAAAGDVPTPRVAQAVAGATVMVVEDEPVLLQFAARVLGAAGYVVCTAADGHAARELLEGGATPPACLVTDVLMPGLSGIEVAAWARQRWPSLPVLFMSGHVDVVAEKLASGARTAFLAKPYGPEALVAQVAALMAAPTAER